mmetsp:Transcript_1917/g.2343  ORF Transcript_1917/g.2343 Transcript_1917/m.2343 type:complete len:499 (-) Transcript_1917:95-1591(-)
MSSIPFDPTLTLGNLCDPRKIRALGDIAECNKPADAANDAMQNIILSNYKFKMIYQQMISMGIPIWDIFWLWLEMKMMQSMMAMAAKDWAKKVVKAQEEIKKLKDGFFMGIGGQEQSQIGADVESPVDFERSEVKPFPMSFDSIKFDVQYFRNEEQDDTSHAATVSAHMGASASMDDSKQGGIKGSAEASMSMNAMTSSQTSNHKIEGSLCITANCTHKNASVIAPLVLDPEKAVTAWNYTFPWTPISTDPISIFLAATIDFAIPYFLKPKLHILSGVTRASSFLGCVHFLQEESTTESQSSVSIATAMKADIQKEMYAASLTGSFGASALSKSMSSRIKVSNNVSLVCNGVIPDIAVKGLATTCKMLQPSANEIMTQLQTIGDASGGAVNGNHSQGAKCGQQYMELSNSHLQTSISALGEHETSVNSIIDTNSMFAAFTNYVEQCIGGECGVPINFYTKCLTKADVAKLYIRKFYPNGPMADPEELKKGQMGISKGE